MGPEILKYSSQYGRLTELKNPNYSENELDSIKNKIQEIAKGFYKNYDVNTDQQIFDALSFRLKEILNDDQFNTIFEGNSLEEWSYLIYTKSIFTDKDLLTSDLWKNDLSFMESLSEDKSVVLVNQLLSYFSSEIRVKLQEYNQKKEVNGIVLKR